MLTAPRDNIINNALKERNKRGYFKTLIGRLHVVVTLPEVLEVTNNDRIDINI